MENRDQPRRSADSAAAAAGGDAAGIVLAAGLIPLAVFGSVVIGVSNAVLVSYNGDYMG